VLQLIVARLSFQGVSSNAGGLPIVLRHPLNGGIELAVFATNKFS
jgi:hypothetical protein